MNTRKHNMLTDKRVVITGGATGIGKATAIYFASLGATIVLGDNNTDGGNKTVEYIRELGGTASFFPLNVAEETSVRTFTLSAENILGGIDILVASAGIFRESLTPVEDVDEISWDLVTDVNLKGSFLTVKHVIPSMRRNKGGVIILIASGAGVSGPSSSVPYGSSKGGVHGLSLTLAPKLANDNIRVHDVCPGNINTPLKLDAIDDQVSKIGNDARKNDQIAGLGDPTGIAKIVAFLASDDASYIRGSIFTR